MTEDVARTVVTLVNAQGLHARPSGKIVQLAARFHAPITLRVGGLAARASSIMEVIMLASPKGTEVEIEAHGDDAAAAVEALRALIAGGFGEDLD